MRVAGRYSILWAHADAAATAEPACMRQAKRASCGDWSSHGQGQRADRMLVSTLIWKTSRYWWTSGASPTPSSPQTDSSCRCRERTKERGRGDSQSQSVVPFAHSATRLLPPVATAATLLKNRERVRQEINKCDYGDWFPNYGN